MKVIELEKETKEKIMNLENHIQELNELNEAKDQRIIQFEDAFEKYEK